MTTYEYDGDRLVGSVTEREPEWSQTDVEALVAYLELRRDIGPHGQPISEAISPDADPNNRHGKYRYEVGLPVTDFAQAAIDKAIDEYKRAHPKADMSSLRFGVRKVAR